MANSENTITRAFVNVLRNMRDAWRVNEQITKPFLNVSQRPDVIVTETGRNPIVIEVKIDGKTPNLSGMTQAEAHFGMMLDPNVFSGLTYDTVENVLRVRMPARFKTMPQGNIDTEMRNAEDIAYMLINRPKTENEAEPDAVPFTYQTEETEQDNEAEPERFPKKGWLKGSVADIATAIRVGSTPISKINAAADLLEARIEIAAKQLETAIAERPSIGEEIETILFQKSGEQTLRMAMLIITNAFVFQSALAGKPEMQDVLSLKRMLSDNAKRLRYDKVLAGWNVILNVNYRPIFYVAKRHIEAIATDDELIDRVLAILCRAARELVDQRLTQVHELAGTVFQRLIVDRKYIKANYTRLESASLLSAIVLPKTQEDLSELKVADFACGTGSLLNGVYQRILELYEQTGGNGSSIHIQMIEKNLDCPLQIDSAWDAVRIKEMALIQSAYRLANGEMWLPIQANPLEIQMCSVEDIAGVSAHHRDIHEEGERGAFDVEKNYSNTDLYPGLWHQNAPAQRAMVVEPDCHLTPRPNRHDKARDILSRNGRVHFNVMIGFNANSLGVLFTEKSALGINSLPNVVLKKPIYDYVWTLWGNSTLGFLLHWAHSGKQQPGRGRGSRTSLLQMPTLDVRRLSDKALTNAERIFHDLKHKRMLPFNESDHDPVRHELDLRLLNEVLDITSEDAHNAVHRLRELLCAEPSIHGGKKSKCNLEKEWEKLKRQDM